MCLSGDKFFGVCEPWSRLAATPTTKTNKYPSNKTEKQTIKKIHQKNQKRYDDDSVVQFTGVELN